jgi:type IV pilus assembly protein PilB
MAHKFQVAPLRKRGNLIEIAVTDPLDLDAVDYIERYTKMEVETVICTQRDLIYLQRSFYRSFAEVDDVLQKIEKLEINKDEKQSDSTDDVEVSSLEGMAEEAPIVVLVNSILFQAIQENASDIHICPQKNRARIRLRVEIGRAHV